MNRKGETTDKQSKKDAKYLTDSYTAGTAACEGEGGKMRARERGERVRGVGEVGGRGREREQWIQPLLQMHQKGKISFLETNACALIVLSSSRVHKAQQKGKRS